MSKNWVIIETRQATAEDFARPTYKLVPHTFKGKILSWAMCTGCGMLFMRHSFTQWCIRMGCLNEYHSDYDRQRKMKRAA